MVGAVLCVTPSSSLLTRISMDWRSKDEAQWAFHGGASGFCSWFMSSFTGKLRCCVNCCQADSLVHKVSLFVWSVGGHGGSGGGGVVAQLHKYNRKECQWRSNDREKHMTKVLNICLRSVKHAVIDPLE